MLIESDVIRILGHSLCIKVPTFVTIFPLCGSNFRRKVTASRRSSQLQGIPRSDASTTAHNWQETGVQRYEQWDLERAKEFQAASVNKSLPDWLQIRTLHFRLPYNGMVNPGVSYPMLSPCSWQPSLNTGIRRPYIILLSTPTTLPFVTPTQSAVGHPPSA